MIPATDRREPFAPGLDAAERLARLRAMRAIARLLLGPRGQGLVVALCRAETDADALEPALRELDSLAALDRRAVLASYAALHQGSR